MYTKINKIFADYDPLEKERDWAIKMLWHRVKNKNDAEDILMDAKVDNKRIFAPVAHARRVKMKAEK